ncbi:MAG: 16S rRNA (guanine(527)-N(7))-methyltransferase RsmG [Fimbriimonadaceae bacterium]|nr:16S rRNA (guanine(527)-N(7))-methyltransferase RsmG [Chthonomonadaceae bacterium]MCO5295386.1 16S rRNA (guanine(527)-N(7))-methyltransferase RsmG [Fimbriimonadaceae bacterium]
MIRAPEVVEALARFEEALYRANEVMNLTRVPRGEFMTRHVADSLLVAEFADRGASVLDIGTGAGFPAWPLAAVRPDLQVTALDSSGKATRFLEQLPLPNLTVVNARAEAWGVRDRFDLVTGRAVAPLALQLELSAAPCRVGGIVLPMRTPAEREEAERVPVKRLGLTLESLEERAVPGTDVTRLLPVYRKVEATAQTYPRPWAEMRRKPL